MNGRINHGELQVKKFSLPEIGKIKIGLKDEKTGFPKSVDYFIPSGNYAPLFTEIFGDKPNIIEIAFISDELTYSCNQRYVLRNNAGVEIGRVNGTEFEIYSNGAWRGRNFMEDGVFNQVKYDDMISLNWLSDKKAKWTVELDLRFIIPQIKEVAGVWRFSTKGKASSIEHITQTFDSVQNLLGTCMANTFFLEVKKVSSKTPEGLTRNFPVVNLVPKQNYNEQLAIRKQLLSGESPLDIYKQLSSPTVTEATPTQTNNTTDSIEYAEVVE